MLFDLPLEQLKSYKPEREEPSDFDSFWHETLLEARQLPLSAQFQKTGFGLKLVDTFDVTFNGFGGHPIKAWLIVPKNISDPLPCIVEYAGYGGGRSIPLDRLMWSCAGYAHLIMDTRGQGSSWSSGDTSDPEPFESNPHYPGFMTRGILNPKNYYYRRVFTDAVRAVETAKSFAGIDSGHIVVAGGSQGGGIALAVSGLIPDLWALLTDVPFLCHYKTATEITDEFPYNEISKYCQTHRDKVDVVFKTLQYFDGVNFAARAKCPALFSVGLMDETCPPRTVFAAYNHYCGNKKISIWKYNHHEGGGVFNEIEKLHFLNDLSTNKLIWNVTL